MKRFKAEKAQKSCKLHDICVSISTCALVGGGAI